MDMAAEHLLNPPQLSQAQPTPDTPPIDYPALFREFGTVRLVGAHILQTHGIKLTDQELLRIYNDTVASVRA